MISVRPLFPVTRGASSPRMNSGMSASEGVSSIEGWGGAEGCGGVIAGTRMRVSHLGQRPIFPAASSRTRTVAVQ